MIKNLTGLIIAGLLVCTFLIGFAVAQTPPVRPLAKEEPIWQELQKIAPQAVNKFKAATVAMDEQKFDEAAKLYREVLKQAPDFEPALRRLGSCLVALGQRDEGVRMSKRALDLHRTPVNLLSHAISIAGVTAKNYQPTENESRQALEFAKEALQKNKENDPDFALVVAQLALSANDMVEFNAAVSILNKKFPGLPDTHYFNGIRLANNNDLDGGEAEIHRAEALGMSTEATQPILAAITQARAEANPPLLGEYAYIGKYFYYGLIVVAVWAVGLFLLFLVGKTLSIKTLNSIKTADPNDITGERHAGLRKLYRFVISFASFYYYVSQPIVMMLVLAIAMGIIVGFFMVGYIPIKIVAIVGIGAVVTVVFMIKSFFVRVVEEDPGRALSEAEAPKLWATVREVADALKTRPVSEIRITIGTDVAVYERGSMRAKLRDQAERILILGVAALNDFDQNAFRAVLAHEYGHFSHRDTAGGDIAFRVNQRIFALAQAMAESGTATFYNLAFQFLRLYHFIFRRITHGATRLQEVLADRVAVYHYGAAAFRDGLTHVIRREIEFSHLADREISASSLDRRALQNLYELKVESDAVKGELEARVAEAIARATTEDDTHPSPQDRFRLAALIKSKVSFPVRGEVWDLFHDREALTNEMNRLIAESLGRR